MRSVLAILAGAVVWSVLWVGGTAALEAALPTVYTPNVRLESVPALLFLIVLSVALSVLAGYVTAAVARRAEVPHTLALGILQLALGIYFELSYWDLLPVWYHLVFLALLIPANVYGGILRRDRASRLAPT